MFEINVAQPVLSQGSATVIGMGHLLGYARVSTVDQQPSLPVDAHPLAATACRASPPATGSPAIPLEQVLDQRPPHDTSCETTIIVHRVGRGPTATSIISPSERCPTAT